MKDIEEMKIREVFRAFEPAELTVGMQEIPDSIILKEVIRRYSFMVDLADAYSRVRPNVEKAHEISHLEWR